MLSPINPIKQCNHSITYRKANPFGLQMSQSKENVLNYDQNNKTSLLMQIVSYDPKCQLKLIILIRINLSCTCFRPPQPLHLKVVVNFNSILNPCLDRYNDVADDPFKRQFIIKFIHNFLRYPAEMNSADYLFNRLSLNILVSYQTITTVWFSSSVLLKAKDMGILACDGTLARRIMTMSLQVPH